MRTKTHPFLSFLGILAALAGASASYAATVATTNANPITTSTTTTPIASVKVGYLPSVVGSWDVMANQTPGVMNITSQSTAAGPCKKIYGNFLSYPLEGFYCPSSGRIQILRQSTFDQKTFQVFSGNLSFVSSGVNYMSGSFSSFNISLGEYSFYASLKVKK